MPRKGSKAVPKVVKSSTAKPQGAPRTEITDQACEWKETSGGSVPPLLPNQGVSLQMRRGRSALTGRAMMVGNCDRQALAQVMMRVQERFGRGCTGSATLETFMKMSEDHEQLESLMDSPQDGVATPGELNEGRKLAMEFFGKEFEMRGLIGERLRSVLAGEEGHEGAIDRALFKHCFGAGADTAAKINPRDIARAVELKEFADYEQVEDGEPDDEDDYSSCDYDPRYLQQHSESTPIPWGAFAPLRHPVGRSGVDIPPAAGRSPPLAPPPKLSLAEHNLLTRLTGMVTRGVGSVHDHHPFIARYFQRLCPDVLRACCTSEWLRRKDVLASIAATLEKSDLHNSAEHALASEFLVGSTLLVLGVITGDYALCELCLKLGANPNSCTFLSDPFALPGVFKHGYSPVFLAVLTENLPIINLLQAHGGTIHTADRWGRTPLHAAAETGNKELITWCIEEGATRNAVDAEGRVPGIQCLETGAVRSELTVPSALYRTHCSGSAAPPNGDLTSNAPQSAKNDTGGVNIPLCPCGSGYYIGACGCFDDMCRRWYSERAKGRAWGNAKDTCSNRVWSTCYERVRDAMKQREMEQRIAFSGAGRKGPEPLVAPKQGKKASAIEGQDKDMPQLRHQQATQQ